MDPWVISTTLALGGCALAAAALWAASKLENFVNDRRDRQN